MNIRWSPLALERIEEIGSAIATEAPITAHRVMQRILDAVGRLDAFPMSGRVVPEIGNPVIREVIDPPYRILYQVHQDVVEVLTVIHSRQSLE